jgi:hypothetical protein
MPLSRIGEQTSTPVTLPPLPWLEAAKKTDGQVVHELRAHLAEHRVIRAGVEAWRLTQKSASFENWTLIGKALVIGRDIAERTTGATTGRHYAKSFFAWADQHGFNGMNKEARWSAVDLVENLGAVEAWRNSLPAQQRKLLIHPLANLRRWRRSLTPKPEPDRVAQAEAAFARFIACIKALPKDEAAAILRKIAPDFLRVGGFVSGASLADQLERRRCDQSLNVISPPV